jgi:transposase
MCVLAMDAVIHYYCKTRSQGVRAFGLPQARSRGLRKTRLQEVAPAAAMDLSRRHHWLDGDRPTTTRRSPFARLAVA